MTKALPCTILLLLNYLILNAQGSYTSQNSLYQSYITARSLENPDELLKAGQDLLHRDKQFAPAWVLIGKAYNSKSQMPHPKKDLFADSARIAARKAMELDPESTEALSFAALQDFLNGKISDSRYYQYKLDTELELSRGLSFNNLNEGRLTEAYKWSDAALTAYPNADWALRYHGINAYTLGFYEEAEHCFQKIISAADKMDLDAHYRLAHLYLATNQIDKATEQYELFRKRRYYAEGRIHLSAFLFASQLGIYLGKNEEALEDLDLFLKETHNYWMPPQVFGYQLTTLRAFLLINSNKKTEAETALSQSREKAEALLSKGNEGYGLQLDLAATYTLQNNSEKALEHLSKAVDSGFRDDKLLAINPMFNSIKHTEKFQEITETIRSKIELDAEKINLRRK